MGCDIHAMAEIKTAEGWKKITTPIFRGKYGDMKPTANPGQWRNYDAFSVLADVRNGYGFAGVPTGSGWRPIAVPRGVPDDASVAFKKDADRWGIDGHSHSWMTLRELQDYGWDEEGATKYGVMSEREYIKFLRTGKAASYSGGVSGGSVEVLSPDEWEEMFGGGYLDPPSTRQRDPRRTYYIQAEWFESAREATGPLQEDIADLAAFADERGKSPDEVRLVFFFDN